ncbi:MAG: hypothetical protein ICV79_15015 [Flavisolibacter sp.]|nr:hypothetical protein [Flavisolibacter sp.]
MKTNIFIFCATILMAACNDSPKPIDPATAERSETTIQPEIESDRLAVQEKSSADASAEKKIIKKKTASQSHSTVSGSGSVASESSNTAKAKRAGAKLPKVL